MKGQRQRWTQEELDLVRKAYECWPPDYGLLPHKSRNNIQNRAYLLGLTKQNRVPKWDVSPLEWAWLAGFIDGEGSIGTYKGGPAVAKGRCWIVIANTDREILDWIARKWPGCSVAMILPGDSGSRGRFTGKNIKPLYQLRWSRIGVVAGMLRALIPYMRVKKEKAEWLLKLIEDHPLANAG